MNRKKLMAVLKSAGYAGEATLDAIQTWLAAENIEIRDADGKAVDVAKAFNAKAVIITPTEGEQIEIREPEDAGDAEIEQDAMEEEEEGEAKSARNPARKSVDRPTLKVDADNFRSKTPASFAIGNADVSAYKRAIQKGTAVFDDPDKAMAFGAFVREAVFRVGKNSDRDILRKSQLQFENSRGGALVPEIFEPDLIYLFEQFGVSAELADTRTTSSNAPIVFPRNTGGPTVYGLNGEGSSNITESNVTYDNVEMVFKSRYTLIPIPNNLLDASAINIADDIARSITRAFAEEMDDAYFNGDGTSAFFGVTGVREKLTGLSGTVANIAGLQVASGNEFVDITLEDIDNMLGRLPTYADAGTRLVMHKRLWHGTLANLIKAAGGTPKSELNGRTVPSYEGYPVVFAQKMPKTDANSQVAILAGDFAMGSKIARVRGGIELATSEHSAFGADRLQIRGKHTVAINVHDVGNASATASEREAGPIVGLISAAS